MSGNRRPLGGAFGFLNSVFDDPFFSQGFGGAFEAHFGGVERVPAPSSTAREIRIDGPEDDAQPTQNRSAGPVIHELPDHEEPGYLFLSSSQPDHVHEPEDESYHHKNGQVHTPATLTPLDASAPPPAADQRASAPAPDVVTQVGPQHHAQQPQQQQAQQQQQQQQQHHSQQQQQQQQPATVRAPKGIRVRAAADAAGNNAQEAAPKAAAAPAAEGGEEEEPGSPLLVHLQAGMLRGGDTPRHHHSHGAHGGAASPDWLGNDSLQEGVPPQEQQQLYISHHLPKEHHASQSQQLPTHHTSQQQQQRQYTSRAPSQQQYHSQHPSQQQRQSPAAQKAPDLVVSTPTGQASAAVDISPAAAWTPDGGTQPATVAGSFPGGFAFEEARRLLWQPLLSAWKGCLRVFGACWRRDGGAAADAVSGR
ncbi:hypothetical protein D9Q98_009058 [Chlorella vulgaris]|uniref:Uncharacterized protein n=1 Tax=Chlorella vulgaris TaxID=3077 RepID=A0A9D4TH39_CHLVU|nr:hypothetical protein D9Q98_009058 [Chlorella vulgaris]